MARIQNYLEEGRFRLGQEGVILEAIRNTAGFLLDLAESNAGGALPERSGVPTAPECSEALEKGANEEAKTKEDPAKEKGAEESDKEEVPKVKKEKKRKKPKRDEKERGKKDKEKKEEDREKKAKRPKKEASSPRVEENREEEEDDKEEAEAAEPSSSGITLQEAVDRRVREHPKEYFLGSLPVRGSAGSHFERQSSKGSSSDRPPEPVHPPRHNDGRKGPKAERPRSRSRRRGTKGRWHQQRGRERREFWRHQRRWESKK